MCFYCNEESTNKFYQGQKQAIEYESDSENTSLTSIISEEKDITEGES